MAHVFIGVLAIVFVVFGGAASALAQVATPVRILVGAPAGGSTDTLARALAQEMGRQLGRTVARTNEPPSLSQMARKDP